MPRTGWGKLIVVSVPSVRSAPALRDAPWRALLRLRVLGLWNGLTLMRSRSGRLEARIASYSGTSITLHCVVGVFSASNAWGKPSKPTVSVTIADASMRPWASMSMVNAKSCFRYMKT